MFSVAAWVVTGALTVWFIVGFVREPRRLRTGVLPILILVSIIGALIVENNDVATLLASLILLAVFMVAFSGYVLLIPFLLINGILVLRREGRSLTVFIPLLVAILLIVTPVFGVWAWGTGFSDTQYVLPSLGVLTAGISAYLSFVFLSFLLSGLLYRARVREYEADAILVLGSRVFGDRVPPLLASRLDTGIERYRSIVASGSRPPVLICCGGKGDDERVPEAEAMATYLRAQGIPASHIREENQSRNTQENLKYGFSIAQQITPKPRIIIATNDYHSFRTALLARKQGLTAQVVGAPTAAYYRPAAFLREYIAILRDYALMHAGMVVLFVTVTGALAIQVLQ